MICFENNISKDIVPTNIGSSTSNFDLTTDNFDLNTTFNLHSRPNSNRFIYLNFIGHELPVDSQWFTTQYFTKPHTTPPFGGNGTMSITNKSKIQYIWRIVSDAFSIWDVDVTTEKPSNNVLTATIYDNPPGKYGIQCVIGGFYDKKGGIAYMDSFGGKSLNKSEPAFIFSESLQNISTNVAYAILHEVGHSLGLRHKGLTSPETEYYAGHGPWAPIMGGGYGRPVIQWSDGNYLNANNTDDEIAIISTVLTRIDDDFGNVFTNATYIKNSDTILGIINSKEDIDTFKLILDASAITITASVLKLMPMLKVGMSLYNNEYTLVASNEIREETVNVLNTMNASILYNASGGVYYLKIFGVGGNGLDNNGNPITSFNDYSSIGNYKITGTWKDTGLIITINDIKVKVENKIYDGNTNATITKISSSTLGNSYTIITTAKFINKSVANNKAVIISDCRIEGGDNINYIFITPTDVTASITPKPLTITGTAANKIYNGNTTATTISGSFLSGIIPEDIVTLITTNTIGSFASKKVGNNKPVTVTGFALSGTDAGNYTITLPTDVTGNITPKPLTITGTITNSKIYNRNAIATLSGSVLSGIITKDRVTLNKINAKGSFDNINVGTNKPVTITGFALSGTDAGNYTITPPTDGTASITKKTLTITGTKANNKIYDANTTATIYGSVLSGIIPEDEVTLITANTIPSFASKQVGNNKPVTVTGFTLSGTNVGNYTIITQPIGVKANITKKQLTITGTEARNKIYDGNNRVIINTDSSQLSGVLNGDSVTLDKTNAKGSFLNNKVATNKLVNIVMFKINGVDSLNYTLVQPTNVYANISII